MVSGLEVDSFHTALWVSVALFSPPPNDDKLPLSSGSNIHLSLPFIVFLSLLQLIVYAIPTCITCFLATLGIWSSTPPTPPSASAASSSSEPFIQGIKLVRTHQPA